VCKRKSSRIRDDYFGSVDWCNGVWIGNWHGICERLEGAFRMRISQGRRASLTPRCTASNEVSITSHSTSWRPFWTS